MACDRRLWSALVAVSLLGGCKRVKGASADAALDAPAVVPSGRSAALSAAPASSEAAAESEDAGRAPESVGTLVDRGWSRWLSGAPAGARNELKRARELRGRTNPSMSVGTGGGELEALTTSGNLAAAKTKAGLFLFLISSGQPLRWRSIDGAVSSPQAFAFHKSAELIVAQSAPPAIRILDATTLEDITTLPTSSGAVSISRDGKLIAYVGPDRATHLYDVEAARERWAVRTSGDGDPAIFLFSPDTSSIAVVDAAVTPRGPKYQSLTLLRIADHSTALATPIVNEPPNGKGAAAAAVDAPPVLKFASNSATLDFRERGKMKRVNVKTGAVTPAPPAPPAHPEKAAAPTKIVLPQSANARVCHFDAYLVPEELCQP